MLPKGGNCISLFVFCNFFFTSAAPVHSFNFTKEEYNWLICTPQMGYPCSLIDVN